MQLFSRSLANFRKDDIISNQKYVRKVWDENRDVPKIHYRFYTNFVRTSRLRANKKASATNKTNYKLKIYQYYQ